MAHKSKKFEMLKLAISEDFPKEIRYQRKQLLEQMKIARSQGCKAFVTYNKLVVNGKEYELRDMGGWKQQISAQTPTEFRKAGGRTVSDRSPTQEEHSSKNLKLL